MLISMTGFGQGEATTATSAVTVEIRSVNHRFLDLAFKLPRVLQNREADIKDIVRAKLARVSSRCVTTSIRSTRPSTETSSTSAPRRTLKRTGADARALVPNDSR